MKFISRFPICIGLLWVCAAPYSVAAEDVGITDCFKTHLQLFVACRAAAEAGTRLYSLGHMYGRVKASHRTTEAAASYRPAQGDASAQVSLGWAKAWAGLRRQRCGIVGLPSGETLRHVGEDSLGGHVRHG